MLKILIMDIDIAIDVANGKQVYELCYQTQQQRTVSFFLWLYAKVASIFAMTVYPFLEIAVVVLLYIQISP